MFPTEISTLDVSRNSNTTGAVLMMEDSTSTAGGIGSSSSHSTLTPSIHHDGYERAIIITSTTSAGITRTLSEGELSVYSAVYCVRDTMASVRRTRESLRKSRVSLQALRLEAEKTLQDARALRREMQELLGRRDKSYYHEEHEDDSHHHSHGSERPTTYDSDLESDVASSLADDESFPC